jgi:hypothetical protein
MRKVYKWNALKAKATSAFLTATNRYASLVGGIDRELAIAAILEHNLADRRKCATQEEKEANWQTVFDRLREEVVTTIDRWDVRSVNALIEQFPDIVRQQDKGKRPRVEMNDNGDWIVIFT